ncbi:putative triacylglycerol lipase [Helianthus annuus]|nr:putative triacylglycerol lipase [Helianthus annuus]KAJ0913480.1 putative triacylglycerol lipase [Helianthus annuus]
MFSVYFFIIFSFSYGSHSHFLVTSVYLHGNGATYLPDNVSVPAIIAFGDSLLDPGNNNRLMTFTKANFPPYGKDFVGGKPTGRFTNGKTLGDFLGTYSFACSLLVHVITLMFINVEYKINVVFCRLYQTLY